MKLYKIGGQRWMYTCSYNMAVLVVWSPLESLLALDHIFRMYSKAYFIVASLRSCMMCAWQSITWELRLRDMYIRRSWILHTKLLADINLWVCGWFEMNVDELKSSPWPSYNCHHHYQLWMEYAYIYPQSVGCWQQIFLENLSPIIQFSTISIQPNIVIIHTITIRHSEISLWWAK